MRRNAARRSVRARAPPAFSRRGGRARAQRPVAPSQARRSLARCAVAGVTDSVAEAAGALSARLDARGVLRRRGAHRTASVRKHGRRCASDRRRSGSRRATGAARSLVLVAAVALSASALPRACRDGLSRTFTDGVAAYDHAAFRRRSRLFARVAARAPRAADAWANFGAAAWSRGDSAAAVRAGSARCASTRSTPKPRAARRVRRRRSYGRTGMCRRCPSARSRWLRSLCWSLRGCFWHFHCAASTRRARTGGRSDRPWRSYSCSSRSSWATTRAARTAVPAVSAACCVDAPGSLSGVASGEQTGEMGRRRARRSERRRWRSRTRRRARAENGALSLDDAGVLDRVGR